MTIFVFLLLFLVAIVVILLFIPFDMIVSTDRGVASFQYGKLLSAGIKSESNNLIIYLSAPFIKKKMTIDELILKNSKPSSKKLGTKKPPSSTGKYFMKRIRKKWKKIISTFQIKQMEVNVDTDNYIINAYLYPIVLFFGMRYNKPICINFQGVNRVNIVIRNRLANLLRAAF